MILMGCGSDDGGYSESSSIDAVEIEKPGWGRSEKIAARNGCEDACVRQGNTMRGCLFYCECALDIVETRYSPQDFLEDDARIVEELTEDGSLDKCIEIATDGLKLKGGSHENANTFDSYFYLR
jgi:hypothetical protein